MMARRIFPRVKPSRAILQARVNSEIPSNTGRSLSTLTAVTEPAKMKSSTVYSILDHGSLNLNSWVRNDREGRGDSDNRTVLTHTGSQQQEHESRAVPSGRMADVTWATRVERLFSVGLDLEELCSDGGHFSHDMVDFGWLSVGWRK